MITDTAHAIAVANAIFSDRFPGADFAFVSGPAINGEKYAGSRAVMVVVYRALPSAYRETFVVSDVPVDVFVHDPATLALLVEQDAARGYHSMLATIAQAQVIGRRIPVGRILQSKMIARLEAGPPAITAQQLDDLRFAVTEVVDALKGPCRPEQMIGMGACLYPQLAELSLRGRGYWTGTGQWLRALLDEVEPGLGARFDQAFAQLIGQRKPELVLKLAGQELERVGGPLFAGYNRDASSSQRSDTRSPLAGTKERV
jgi:hypothetical protein